MEMIAKTHYDALNYSLTYSNGNRSSFRTDQLNTNIIEIFETILEQKLSYQAEQNIDCARGKKFAIDLVLKKDNKPIAFLLLKCVESSYNKNRHNYMNGIIGECQRIYGKGNKKKYEKTPTYFVNLIPTSLPVRNNKGEIKNFEQTQVCDIEADLDIFGSEIYLINWKFPIEHDTLLEADGFGYHSYGKCDEKVLEKSITKINKLKAYL